MTESKHPVSHPHIGSTLNCLNNCTLTTKAKKDDTETLIRITTHVLRMNLNDYVLCHCYTVFNTLTHFYGTKSEMYICSRAHH